MVDDARCNCSDYSLYRSTVGVVVPGYVDPSILSAERDALKALITLTRLKLLTPRAPKRNLDEAVGNTICRLPPLTRWFRRGKEISSPLSSRPERASKRLRLESGEAPRQIMLISGAVGSDTDERGEVSVYKRHREAEEPVECPTRKIAHASNSGIDQPTVLFINSVMFPKHFPGEKRNKNDAERLYFLQQDPWVQKGSIKPQKVVCRGCGKAMQLEKRNTSTASGKPATYYLSPWVKHRNKCRGVHRTWLIVNGYDAGVKLSKEILENYKPS